MTDVVVVGSGPNGLTAAVVLARAGLDTLVLEASDTPGGGTRTAELTNPGVLHDVCSAFHPLGAASPAFEDLGIATRGVEWVRAPIDFAHPLDDGTAAVFRGSVADTASGLGADGRTYRKTVSPLVNDWPAIADVALGPLLRMPRHPLKAARFGLAATQTADRLGDRFSTPRGRALIAGMSAHASVPFDTVATAGVALVFAAVGHRVGWPMAAGGSARITDALLDALAEAGGRLQCGVRVSTLDDVPDARVTLLDVTDQQFATIAAGRLAPNDIARYATREGSAAFKVDFELSRPVPWEAPAARQAGVVHLGGTFEEIAAAEQEVHDGAMPSRPFMLVGQQSLFDPTRAPQGTHTLWSYAHVPLGWDGDATGSMIDQIERFAPGFSASIVDRHVMGTADLAAYNPNYLDGQISGGALNMRRLLGGTNAGWDPYGTPLEGVFLCSSSTPPGAGVHGMCGWHAARSARRYLD